MTVLREIEDDATSNSSREAAARGYRTDPPRKQEAPVQRAAPAPADEGLTAEAVFRDHAARVFSLAHRMLGNEADAEDATQEVLLQVVRKIHTFRGEAALATWLYRVTANAALALRRKRAARKEQKFKDPLDNFLEDGSHVSPVRAWGPAPDEQALGQELREKIDAAIAQLPAIYRDVFVLADVEGLTNAETGASLGLSLPAVKSRLHRARLMMRQALAPHFEEPNS